MDLTNERYQIKIKGKSFTERYYRDAKGWVKVSARRRRFRATAEQVLNHLLPALAGVKPGLRVEVEHRQPAPRPSKGVEERRRGDSNSRGTSPAVFKTAALPG